MTSNQILTGWLITNIVSLLILGTCWWKPSTGRTVFSVGFLIASFINLALAFLYPEAYLAFAQHAVPPYRTFIEGAFAQNPALFVVPIAIGQFLIAAFVALGGKFLRVGVVGAAIFLVAIAPLGIGSGFPSTVILAFAAVLLPWRAPASFNAHRAWAVSAMILIAASAAGCVWQTQPSTDQVTLFFYSEGDLQTAYFDHPIAVHRTVTATENTMDMALRQLFAGPTDAEEEKGARTSDDLASLGPLYLGVTQEGDAAIVNFRTEALTVLNSAAARQFMVKSPIRATLLQFPGIEEVRYAIDGKMFDEWDA